MNLLFSFSRIFLFKSSCFYFSISLMAFVAVLEKLTGALLLAGAAE
jgi:hypothetical protein